jgi:crossover junction endodeoxyribonuclease RuvC
MLVAAKAGLPIFEYTPLQIKQTLTGYGRAEKKQIQAMVRVHLGLKSAPAQDDAADALATAITHALMRRLQLV